MSLALLLEKYDVSTEEGLQKALNEIEKEEAEVDETLSGVLSRACELEGRLRSASRAYTTLGAVKNDAQTAADMVDRTATLARDVSAKVRQLDLARSRVAECQRRVHDLIDLQLCSAGVEAALKAKDFEAGAAHVARYLCMDPGSVAAARARGAPDPRDAMTRAADTLREQLVRKFEEAARREDEAAVERLFKLFPQIGRAEEGVQLLSKFLATQAEASIRRAAIVSDPNSGGAVFADALTRVLEAGGACVQRTHCTQAAGALHAALPNIQPVICAGARRVYNEMRLVRKLDVTDPRRSLPNPLAAEPILAELALAHSRVKLYFTFLRRKAEADVASLGEEAKRKSLAAIEKTIAECDLMRTAQDLLGHYLALERYFLEESVNKALKMATPQVGATSSSLVDDVFFIARKVIRRSLSSGSVDGACAVLNDVSSLLEREVAAALRRWVRSPPADPLPLPSPASTSQKKCMKVLKVNSRNEFYGFSLYENDTKVIILAIPSLDAVGSLAQRLNRDVDAQRMLFLAHMNEAEAGAEWSERLATEACNDAEQLYRPPNAASERDKLHSCASGLGSAAAAFRAAYDLAIQGIKAGLKQKVLSWAEVIVDPGADPDELEDDADALPSALDSFAEATKMQLSARASETILCAVVSDIAIAAETRILQHHYDREGGLLVERRARRLAAWAGSNAAAARERCARLTQAAALLALEKPSHAHEALMPAARLAPAVAREVLARRTDFRMEDIKRLKL